ncbi:MAG: hypothetical protein RML57_11545 [Acidobacteriota bacterium]|nr:hypothetical protein [Acidobacteriota bacterium]
MASLFPPWCALGQGFDLNDDAYITLTYAKNLAAGRGFVFNHPPATFGTTTPLLALLVGALAALLPNAPVDALAVWLTAAAWIAAGWIFFIFRRVWGLGDASGLLVALAVLFGGWTGPLGVLGSETFLFHALLALALSLHLAGRDVAAGLAVGLLFLTRGEGVLVLGVIGASLFGQWRWAARRASDQSQHGAATAAQRLGWSAFGFGVLFTLWALYAYRTFGQALPATLAAKRAQAALGWPTFTHELTNSWWRAWGGPALGHPLLSPWWALVGVGVVTAVRSRWRWQLWLLWLGAYVGGYAALGVAGYWWYQVPIFLALQLFFALGLVTVFEWLTAGGSEKRRLAGTAVATLGLLWSLTTSAWAVAAYQGDWRAASYRALAAWCRTHAQPTDRVAFHEVGYLGFYSNQRIVDLCGLTTPEVLPHFAQRDLVWPVKTLSPEWYVASPTWDILPALREGGWFDATYRRVAVLPAPNGGELQIFQRIRANDAGTP